MARFFFFFFKLYPSFAKLSVVCLWNDCLSLLWVEAKCCAPICLCRSWQPGWLQNVCVWEPRALLGRVLIAGWQRAAELGGGRGCSVLGKSRFSELIWGSTEPSPRLLYLQDSLDCCWDVRHLQLILRRKAYKSFPYKRAKAVLGRWQWVGEQQESVGVQLESQIVVQAHSKEETCSVLNQAEGYTSEEPYDRV